MYRFNLRFGILYGIDLDQINGYKECVRICEIPRKDAEMFIYTKKRQFLDLVNTYFNNLPDDMEIQERIKHLDRFKEGESLIKQEISKK